LKDTYNTFAKVIQVVFYLSFTSEEFSLGKMYFGKILAKKIEIQDQAIDYIKTFIKKQKTTKKVVFCILF